MINKSAWRLLIFITGAVMLLLRPYFVYQMTSQRSLRDNPAKAYSLLQRLVKKKDDHHEAQDNPLTETRRNRFRFQSPVKLNQHFYSGLSATRIILHPVISGRQSYITFQIQPKNHRYRFLSCFLI